MTVTQSEIKRLRLMINEPSIAIYTDTDLTIRIEESACIDRYGVLPDEDDWEATYDIYKVASLIWLEKAAKLTDEFDFTADGGTFHRSQKHTMMLKQASYFESRSKALALHLKQYPITSVGSLGWEDLPYNEWIEQFESDLT